MSKPQGNFIGDAIVSLQGSFVFFNNKAFNAVWWNFTSIWKNDACIKPESLLVRPLRFQIVFKNTLLSEILSLFGTVIEIINYI